MSLGGGVTHEKCQESIFDSFVLIAKSCWCRIMVEKQNMMSNRKQGRGRKKLEATSTGPRIAQRARSKRQPCGCGWLSPSAVRISLTDGKPWASRDSGSMCLRAVNQWSVKAVYATSHVIAIFLVDFPITSFFPWYRTNFVFEHTLTTSSTYACFTWIWLYAKIANTFDRMLIWTSSCSPTCSGDRIN